MGDGRVVQL